MIERLPLEAGSKDCKFLQKTLLDFADKTGSEVARRILNDFEAEAKKFVKVFPYEYQRALKEQEEEEQKALESSLSNNSGKNDSLLSSNIITNVRLSDRISERLEGSVANPLGGDHV